MKRFALIAAAVLIALSLLRRPAAAPSVLTLTPAPLPSHAPRLKPPLASAMLVYVVGAVRHTGVYRLRAGARAQDAVRLAGGFTRFADPAAVNLAERVSDGEEIDVPRFGQAISASAPAPKRRTRRSRARSSRRRRVNSAASLLIAPVNLNTADAQTLEDVPGVGPALAERIVEYRALNGPFESTDELADVSGMTQARADALAPYLTLRDASSARARMGQAADGR